MAQAQTTRLQVSDSTAPAERHTVLACLPQMATFWKGRVALYAILRSLGIQSGDQVLVPGYTCFAVPSAVLFAGARPVFVDIEPQTFNVSLDGMQRARAAASRNVKAAIVQHTYGVPADMEPIAAWCRQEGIALIEDCAHALGSRYRDRNGIWRAVGSFGDASFYSSQWTKPISTGLGGWAISSDPALSARIGRFHDEQCVAPSSGEQLLLAAHVLARELASSPLLYWMAISTYQALYRRGILVGTSSQEEFRAHMPKDYAKQMSGFQQWLLSRRLADASAQQHRRQLRVWYEAALRAAGLPVFDVPAYADPVFARYPVRLSDKPRVMAEARRRNIELGEWYRHPVDVPDESAARAFAYEPGMCPQGERAGREVINLPLHARVSAKTVEKTVAFVREFA